ncbi:hypothetical protein CAPTEDRAFT_210303 [Capitella teleta]|uniref:Uncharacterized protein n=1 Tax=Capitella teleta TaxID=283909 RepID=N1PB37_CAPTE|nr:hypothetical protein CAPTEDRAFT_210303 [Capitella teleta]|eukprot:ELU18832.1 hypothetical protein CAPTEDRAFT_210303 [Capitella teleta]
MTVLAKQLGVISSTADYSCFGSPEASLASALQGLPATLNENIPALRPCVLFSGKLVWALYPYGFCTLMGLYPYGFIPLCLLYLVRHYIFMGIVYPYMYCALMDVVPLWAIYLYGHNTLMGIVPLWGLYLHGIIPLRALHFYRYYTIMGIIGPIECVVTEKTKLLNDVTLEGYISGIRPDPLVSSRAGARRVITALLRGIEDDAFQTQAYQVYEHEQAGVGAMLRSVSFEVSQDFYTCVNNELRDQAEDEIIPWKCMYVMTLSQCGRTSKTFSVNVYDGHRAYGRPMMRIEYRFVNADLTLRKSHPWQGKLRGIAEKNCVPRNIGNDTLLQMFKEDITHSHVYRTTRLVISENIDEFKHVNFMWYVLFILEALDVGLSEGNVILPANHYLEEFAISYEDEALEGQEIEISLWPLPKEKPSTICAKVSRQEKLLTSCVMIFGSEITRLSHL